MAGERYTLFAVKVGATVLAGTSSQSYRPQGGTLVPVLDGGPDPVVGSVVDYKPEIEFTTSDIDNALSLLGVLGQDLASLTGGIVLYFRKAGRVASASGSVHITLTATAGLVVPVKLSAPHSGGEAKITYKAVAVSSDGTTAPWTKATTAALGTIATQIAKIYRAGKAKVNGSFINSLTGIELDFGTKVEVEGDSGFAYPTAAYLSERKPKFTITHKDPSFACPTSFSALLVFLRGLTTGGLPYANSDEEHVKLTLAAGLYEEGDSSASPAEEGSFMVHGLKTGSTDIVQAAGGEAIA